MMINKISQYAKVNKFEQGISWSSEFINVKKNTFLSILSTRSF